MKPGGGDTTLKIPAPVQGEIQSHFMRISAVLIIFLTFTLAGVASADLLPNQPVFDPWVIEVWPAQPPPDYLFGPSPEFFTSFEAYLNSQSIPWIIFYNPAPDPVQAPVSLTPEPSTWLLAASALFALFSILDWRRRQLSVRQLWSVCQKQLQKNHRVTFRLVFDSHQTPTKPSAK